jgi:hypothetical protein
MSSSSGGVLGVIVLGAIGLVAIHGWFSDKSKKLKENEFNRELRKKLDEEKWKFENIEKLEFAKRVDEINREFQQRKHYLMTLRSEFEKGYLNGRRWLAQFIRDADHALDDSISISLRNKKHPALKAAEEVSAAKAEKRQIKEQLKFLEYQLKSYKEYFPFLEEYEEVILDEAIPLVSNGANIEAVENADPVLIYVPKIEYENLSSIDRNQLALDRYLTRTLSKSAIGRFYERYLGYLYEEDGWKVEYQGIVKGYEDLGQDLICATGNRVKIVQAKCWAAEKVIHEKHIFQLFGTTQLYLMNYEQEDLFKPDVSAVFITTTTLSAVAKKAAQWLGVEVMEKFALDKKYPMIKCNVNQVTKEKIYHLPFDQQYDRTKISPDLGEFYASTVAEAESKGFRRAFRHFVS